MINPTVSVVIPTYKHRDFVLATLDSVFAQTFTDYEVIVVNDGSPDDTAEVLRPLVESGRIRYIEQANAGQSQARNVGIEAAQGEFVALLDDDDLWLPDKLEWQVDALHQHPEAVMVYGATQAFGDTEFYSPEGEVPSGRVYAAFLRRNWIMSPGQTLIRASALKTISGLDASLWGVDDWDLYVRLASVGEFLYRPQVTLRYRLHRANASRDGWRMYLQSCRLRRKHFGVMPDPRRLADWLGCRRFMIESFHPVVSSAAQDAMNQGDWKLARHLWLKAIRIKPGTLRRGDLMRPIIESLLK